MGYLNEAIFAGADIQVEIARSAKRIVRLETAQR